MSKKYLVLAVVAAGLVVSATALFVLSKKGLVGNPDQALYDKAKGNPVWLNLYNQAKADQKKVLAAPDRAANYLNLGLDWKGLGEVSRDPAFFQKSLSVYEDGIERFGKKNILFYLNAGKVAESLNDYAKAESYYRSTIQISPGDESGYLDLANLYTFHLNKTKADVLAVYDAALRDAGNKSAVTWARAQYYIRINDLANAIKDYQSLVKSLPGHGYEQVLAELKAKLKK